MEERKKELLAICKGKEEETKQLVEEILFLERELEDLKKLPFYKYNPNNARQQKALPAARLYREFLQQYNTSLKTLEKMIGNDQSNEESPLRRWAKKHVSK